MALQAVCLSEVLEGKTLINQSGFPGARVRMKQAHGEATKNWGRHANLTALPSYCLIGLLPGRLNVGDLREGYHANDEIMAKMKAFSDPLTEGIVTLLFIYSGPNIEILGGKPGIVNAFMPVSSDTLNLSRTGKSAILTGRSFPKADPIHYEMASGVPGNDILILNASAIGERAGDSQAIFLLAADANETYLKALSRPKKVRFDANSYYARGACRGRILGASSIHDTSEAPVGLYFEVFESDYQIRHGFEPSSLRLVRDPSNNCWSIVYNSSLEPNELPYFERITLHPDHPVVKRWIQTITDRQSAEEVYPISVEEFEKLVGLQPLSNAERRVRDTIEEEWRTIIQQEVGASLNAKTVREFLTARRRQPTE